jgi:hypothetical protein
MAEKNGDQSRNPDLNLDDHPVSTNSRTRFNLVGEPGNNLQQGIVEQFCVEQFRVWYRPDSEIAQALEERASLSMAGYFHVVRLQALNLDLPETSIGTAVQVFLSYALTNE